MSHQFQMLNQSPYNGSNGYHRMNEIKKDRNNYVYNRQNLKKNGDRHYNSPDSMKPKGYSQYTDELSNKRQNLRWDKAKPYSQVESDHEPGLNQKKQDYRKVYRKSPKIYQKINNFQTSTELAYFQSIEYKNLHQKLDNIEKKISTMKQGVQQRREEKHKLIEMRRRQKQRKKAQVDKSVKKSNLKNLVTQVPEQKQYHTFDSNPYSPNHNIYYVSEIIRAYHDQSSLAREHLMTSLHILRLLQNTKFPTEEEINRKMPNLPIKKGYQNCKTIVFDLDQTLIHCNDNVNIPHDVTLPIKFPTGEIIEAGINIRPYVSELLSKLSNNFQIIVFTASHSCYANVVLDYLDPQSKYIHHRLYRQHCHNTPEGMYIKDLRVIDRSLSKMMLVDNAAYSYAFQLDNGIPILPYYQGSQDYELKALQKYIENMILVDDIRKINKKTFKLNQYSNYYYQPDKLVQQLYKTEQKA